MKIKIHILFFILTLGTAAILLTGCESKLSVVNPSIKILAQKAEFKMNAGDFEGAIARLESINDLNPNLPENYYNLGIAYDKNEQYEKALKALKYSLQLNPNFKDAIYSVAVVYENIVSQQETELKKVKFDKQKLQILHTQIKDNSQKAIEYYKLYIKICDKQEEINKINERISEINRNNS